MIGRTTTGWIGIDIGTSTLKLAQMVDRGGRLVLSEAAIIQRHSPWSSADLANLTPEETSDEIRAALSLGDQFQGRCAAGALPMAVCDVHGLRVTDPRRRSNTIAQQLHNAARGSIENRVFDYWPIDHPSDRDSSAGDNVSVMTVPTAWSTRLAEDVGRAGLRCETLDGMPLALARAVEMVSAGASPEPVAAIDWGYSRATFCAVREGRPLYVRCFKNCGFGRILNELSSATDVSTQQARKLLTKHGVPNPMREKRADEVQLLIAKLLAQPLADFQNEWKRTFTHLETHRPNLIPQRIWLMGGGATIRHIDTYVASLSRRDVSFWKLDSAAVATSADDVTLRVLGPAIALSALAWEVA